MSHHSQLKEQFFKTFRDELLQIPTLPVVSSEMIHSRVQKNEKEAIFEHFLSATLKQDPALDRPNHEMIQDTLRGLEAFEESLKGTNNMASGIKNDKKYRKEKVIPEILYKTIMNTKVEDKSIKFRGFVAIFDITSKDFPLYDFKILQTVCSSYGFHILEHKVLQFSKIKGMLYQKDCLLKNKNISRFDFEELFTNMGGLNFEEMLSEHKLVPRRTLHQRHASTMGRSLAKTAATMNPNFTTSSPMRGGLSMNTQNMESALVLCLMPRSGKEFHEDFQKMLIEKSNLFTEALSFFYASEYRIESLIDVQIFFPELFHVNFMTLIRIPTANFVSKSEMDNKLEDMLNMNNFRVVRKFDASVTKELLIECFQQLFSNHENLANFLLAESKLRIQITAKLGSLFLNDYGLATENFLKIFDPEVNNKLFRYFFPELYKFSQTVLILRPFVLKSSLGELLLNVFRINGFVIVKRISHKMTEQQAEYLAKHEKILPEYEEEYISLMTDGESEIVLMSNFAAAEKATVIVDGNNNEWVKGDQLFEMNLDEDNANPYGNDTGLLFKSMKDTISLGKVYDSSGSSFQARITDERLLLQEKTKILKALLSSSFNFTGFNTKTQEATEELITVFFPDCSKVSDVYLILKPRFRKHEEQVLVLLERLGYKITETKRHHFSTEDTASLLETLEKNEEQSQIFNELQEEWDEELIIFHIVKPAAKKEMISLLRNFFLHSNFKPFPQITKDNLYCYVVPCWNTSSVDFIHTRLYPGLRIFDANVFKESQLSQKLEILTYILQTTIGDNAKEAAATSYSELDQFDTNHINLKIASNKYGEYQIRIRDLADRSALNIQSIKEEYECINLYYSCINKIYSQKSPAFYQYRVVPDDDEATPHSIFDCQEYMGEFFLKIVSEEVEKHKKQKIDKSVLYNSDLFKSNRSPLAAFMFGSRLAVYIKKLEEVKTNGITGFGQIRILDNKPVGVWPYRNLRSLEFQRYNEILSKVSHFIPDVTVKSIGIINDHLEKIFQSETYKYARDIENMRVMPEFMNPQSLRIFKKPDNRDLVTVHENYETINYDFEKATYTQTKSFKWNLDFALIYATPQVAGKYRLIANIIYIIEYEFSQLQRIPELINNSSEEYDALIRGLAEGLHKHHDFDAQDGEFLDFERIKGQNPVDFIQMELFFVILEAIEEKLDRIIETKKVINEEKNLLNQFIKSQHVHDSALKSHREISSLETERTSKSQNIQKLQVLEDTLTGFVKKLLTIAEKLDICPSVEEKGLAKGSKIKISRDRYYKPVLVHNVEYDLFKEKYKQNLTNNVDLRETKYGESVFLQNADRNQSKWLNPPPLEVYNIKRVEERRLPDLYVDPIVIPGEEMEKEIIRKEIATISHFKNLKK